MSMQTITREPVHQKIIELSRAEGLLKALEYFNENDMMDKDDTERIVKDALDMIREVRDYIQDNYQQLRTY